MGEWPAQIEATATAILVLVGAWQIWAIRIQNRVERTLAVCTRYDADPVLAECTRNLRKARNAGEYQKSPLEYRYDAVALLNYLDTVAIGIEQRLYIDSLAFDHLKNIVKLHCDEYLSPAEARLLKIELDNYHHLSDMRARWLRDKPRFKDGWIVSLGRRL